MARRREREKPSTNEEEIRDVATAYAGPFRAFSERGFDDGIKLRGSERRRDGTGRDGGATPVVRRKAKSTGEKRAP